MKEYTFNDADELLETLKSLKEHRSNEKQKNLDLVEALADLIEMHPRNALNFCMAEGMPTLLSVVNTNEEAGVRKEAAQVFGELVQNDT